MLISYLGALKTWFYKGVFLFAPPRPIVLRLPMLLFAAASLWLFFELLDRTIGRRAAWIGTLLLATDTSYLLLNTADYGPVTLQFVFKLAALVLLVRFHQNGTTRSDLAWAFFLFGLGMWDKAIFAWVLFGLAIAAVAVFPRELRKHLSAREHRGGRIGNAGRRTATGDLQHRPSARNVAVQRSPGARWSCRTKPRFSNKPWTATCCSDS